MRQEGYSLSPYTQAEMEYKFQSLGLDLLSDWKNSTSKAIFTCSCGSIGSSTYNSLSKGFKCGKCVESKWRLLFRERNCTILNYRSAADIEYLCACGNVSKTRGIRFINSKYSCSKCKCISLNLSYKRPHLVRWKKQVLTRDNFECQICLEDDDLHIHHIEAFSIRPDLADSLDNGIVLCNLCHENLHRKYGINVGIENLKLECRAS